MNFRSQNLKILVVEDEKKLAQLMQKQLQRTGLAVDLAHDGVEACERMLDNDLSLIVLDINLPKKSGFDVLLELRSHNSTIPVIIVSGRYKVEDRIKGLELGADDYLAKPFDSGELYARISSLLRRTGTRPESILRVDNLTIDANQKIVKRGDETIALSPKEFALLLFFMKNKNQVLTRKRIAREVWGHDFDTQTNIVDVYVSYLRASIDRGYTKKLIHTLHGEGFILSD